MMKTRPTWLLLLTLLTTATLAAQSTQPPPQSQSAQRPIFTSQIDLVSLDITVRDKNGQFVPTLTKNDFTVLEDGVEQQLSSFHLVYGGRELSVEMINAPSAAPDGMILPPTRPVADVAGRVFIIFIDDLHLLASDSPRVRQLLTQITNTLIHDGDMFAVVSTGPSSIEVNSTYDRNRLTEAIKKVMGNGMSPDEILQAPSSVAGPQEIRHRVNVAFSTAYELLEQMKAYNTRRKAFIYLSAGYDFNPFTDSRWKQEQERFARPDRGSTDGTTTTENSTNSASINPFDSGSFGFAGADLVSQLAELVRAANRANTTFYTIDPRGLIAGPDISNQNLTTQEWRRYVQTSVDSLITLGELSGGFCICNSNDFKKGLERIDAETSDYYLLRYYSSNPDPLRRVRNLQVKVKRADLEVVQKRTQWALPIPRKR